MRIVQPLLVLQMLTLALAGCGGSDGPRRVAVTGTVTRAGSPVEIGSVGILPSGDHSGPAANGAVENGEFVFDSSNGPTPGPHRIVIRSLIPKDELMRLQAEGKEPKMSWVFPLEIPDEDVFHHDFVLE
ncbi:hypothetical protein GC176_06545 [bacterium]|nr:hypothetical protein [bacterium]